MFCHAEWSRIDFFGLVLVAARVVTPASSQSLGGIMENARTVHAACKVAKLGVVSSVELTITANKNRFLCIIILNSSFLFLWRLKKTERKTIPGADVAPLGNKCIQVQRYYLTDSSVPAHREWTPICSCCSVQSNWGLRSTKRTRPSKAPNLQVCLVVMSSLALPWRSVKPQLYSMSIHS